MADDQTPELSEVLSQIGRLLAGFLLYGVLAIVVFVTSFFVVGWVNGTVLQPMVGGSGLLSVVLYGATLLFNVLFVWRFVSSDTVSVPESEDSTARTWSDWSGFLGDEGGGGDGGA